MNVPQALTAGEAAATTARSAIRFRNAAARLEAIGGDPATVVDWRAFAASLERTAANLRALADQTEKENP